MPQNKICSIHQPHFLPWLGYWNKIMRSDYFIVLDSVQFRKEYFQNRAQVRFGESFKWLTVPVKEPKMVLLCQSKIENMKVPWQGNICSKVESYYRYARFFNNFWPDLKNLLLQKWERLVDLNTALIHHFCSLLDIKTKFFLASELTSTTDPTQRLLDCIKKIGATLYLSGASGPKYLDLEKFKENKIDLVVQKIQNHPIYPQQGDGFVPNLSIVDALFNVGSGSTLELIEKMWNFDD